MAERQKSSDAFGTFLESMRDVGAGAEPETPSLPTKVLDALDAKSGPVAITDLIGELGESVIAVAGIVADLQKDGFTNLDVNGVKDTVEITETGRRAVRLAKDMPGT